jgi:uncharacterized membrane protein YgdD (TMEM256/DUF423 family)
MTRAWLAAAALGGFLPVGAGAIAAPHQYRPEASRAVAQRRAYGMVHAAALTAVVAMVGHRDEPDLVLIIAGWCFVTGVFQFSFSLGLALTGIALFGRITPLAARLCCSAGQRSGSLRHAGNDLRAVSGAKVAIQIKGWARVCDT